jgi:hypothetical protein
MTRTTWPAALLAASSAFGVGYAVRLACAWMAGPTPVVDVVVDADGVQPRAAERFAGHEVGSQALDPPADAPPPTPASDAHVAPTAGPDAIAASMQDGRPRGADGDGYRKAMYDVFERHGRTADFRRMFDRVAVVPLGRSPSDLGLFAAAASAHAPLVESAADVRTRRSAVNASAGRRSTVAFQFAALRRGDGFEVFVGDSGLPHVSDPRSIAAYLAARAGKSMPGAVRDGRAALELASDKADALVDSCVEAHRVGESARRDLWTRLHGLATSGETAPLDPREIAGVCIVGERCVVLRVGDDPEFDRLLDESDREERAVRAEVECGLRR